MIINFHLISITYVKTELLVVRIISISFCTRANTPLAILKLYQEEQVTAKKECRCTMAGKRVYLLN
jgi:hypothetical protein